MMGWSFLFMFVNAMRLVAPAFAFAIGFATILPDRADARNLPEADRSNNLTPRAPIYNGRAAPGQKVTGRGVPVPRNNFPVNG
jgi:hypothetical protein